MEENKPSRMRQWKSLPPGKQKLLFYQVLKDNGEWQSVTVPDIFEDEFNDLISKYKNEKGLPLKAFQKWYNERIL
jgi:hypothetical protein